MPAMNSLEIDTLAVTPKMIRPIDGGNTGAITPDPAISPAARSGAWPAFIEALTYRFVGHSRSDPGAYRPDGELDEWRKRDPLLVARAGLGERYGIEAERCDEIDAEVAAELERIVEQGLAAPFPDPAADGKEFKYE